MKLLHRPVDTLDCGHDRTDTFYKFFHVIKPFCVLLEEVFEVVVLESFNFYKKVFKSLSKHELNKGQKDCFGIWIS